MKICVLLPDYSTTAVDYQNYDPIRNLQPLLPNDVVDTVLLNKLTTYKQLQQLKSKNYDIFVNLCEGYLHWEVPSIDVIHSLELLNLPYTGPNATLYDPPKNLMKYVAYCAGVNFPKYVAVSQVADIQNIEQSLNFPLFVKPSKEGDSVGISNTSLVKNYNQLKLQVELLLTQFNELLVEEYINGREFTVLVAANAITNNVDAFTPIEYIFTSEVPFKTYELKTSSLHPNANKPVDNESLKIELQKAAVNIFKAFNGVGYARLDFRMDENGTLYFLEINFTCSVFYENGYEGSADYILNNSSIGKAGFLQQIIHEGLHRHQQKQKPFYAKGSSKAGFGIYASRNIIAGEVVFKGEEKAQRIVTKPFVDKYYNPQQLQDFAAYAYPISEQVYILWDEDATQWAPQNHSCNANTAYVGLNVIATKNIVANEELTLDYETFLNESAQPFNCNCGAPNCRKIIKGKKGNTVERRL
ncbi:MAG: SET domain-containing protein-lysine N-methyltransferase [Chitinophagaceae bacterium]